MKREQGLAPTSEYVQGEIERLRQQVGNTNKPTVRFKPVENSRTDFQAQNLEGQESIPAPSVMPQIQEKTVVEEVPTEYQIRQAALGSNPTKEEIAAVLYYGLEHCCINFPHLYEPKASNPHMS